MSIFRLIPSTQGAWRRALILTLYLGLLVAALTVQAHQNRAGLVHVYLQGGMAYAQIRGEAEAHALFPLGDACQVRWTNGAQESVVLYDDLTAPMSAGQSPATERLALLHFSAVGDITVLPGSPWMTIRSRLGDVQVMADCPLPVAAPPTHRMYVYVQGQHLFLYDSTTERVDLLMPLRERLLWSGEDIRDFALDELDTRPRGCRRSASAYEWLPRGAAVVGYFDTSDGMILNNLDESQVQIRYEGHELNLVSYDRWSTP